MKMRHFLASVVLAGFATAAFGELSIDTCPRRLAVGEGDFLTFSCDLYDLVFSSDSNGNVVYGSYSATISAVDDEGNPSGVLNFQKVDEYGNLTGAAGSSVAVKMYVDSGGVTFGIPNGVVYVTGAKPGTANVQFVIKGLEMMPRTMRIEVVPPDRISFRQTRSGEAVDRIFVAESDLSGNASFYLDFGYALPDAINFIVANNAPSGVVEADAAIRVPRGSSDYMYRFKAKDGDNDVVFTFTGDNGFTDPQRILVTITNVPPVIATPSGTEENPSMRACQKGIPSTFFASASDVASDSPLSYRWFKNGELIAVTTGGSFDVAFTDDGTLAVEAVDKDGLVSSRRGWWSVETVPANADHLPEPDAIGSGFVGDNGVSWVETSLRGAGRLSFDWKVSCERRNDYVQLSVDGTAQRRITGETDWATVSLDLGPDDHVVRWTYSKNAKTYSGSDRGYLANVVWTPIAETFGEVLDADRLEWTTSGDAEWVPATTVQASDGVDCAWAGRVGEDEYSRIETEVVGPGTVSFDWLVSGRDGDDWFDFYVDDIPVRSITGTSSWASVSVDIGDGNHTLAWEWFRSYTGNGAELADCRAGLDNVSWTGKTPSQDTESTPVPVPHAWLEEKAAPLLASSGGDYEAAALTTAANGRPVWECYVADLDPTKADDDLKVTIAMKPDGTPEVSILSGESADRVYETQGAPEPGGPWGGVTEESRFFRVKVSLPEP